MPNLAFLMQQPVAPPTANWATLKVGAGGVIGRIDIDASGNMICGADIFGAYACTKAAPTWRGLFTPANNAQIVNSGYGMWDVKIAQSNPNVFWAVSGDGYTYRSVDAGANWARTAFTQMTGANFDVAGGTYRWSQDHLVVDPLNPLVAYLVNIAGVVEATFDGGVTKLAVPGVTGSTSGPGGAGLAIYAGDGTTTVNGQVVCKTIYIGVYGTGVFRSADGGVSFTQISSSGTTGPTQVWQAQVVPSGTYKGTYWCSEMPSSGSGKTWKYVPGTGWTERHDHTGSAMQGIQSCAVDPVMSGRVVFLTRGGVGAAWETLDNGATLVGGIGGVGDSWSGAYPVAPVLSFTDIPWLETTNPGYLETWTGRFDQSSSDGTKCTKLVIGMGVGVAYLNWPTTFSGLTLFSQSLGIEELVCHDIYVPPSSSANPILAAADRPIFVPTIGTYPSVYGPVGGPDFNRCWSLDYASADPTYVVGLTRWFGAMESGYSTDGGKTWHTFAHDPQVNDGGVIACASSTSFVVVSNFENPVYNNTGPSGTWAACAGLPIGTDGSYFPGAYQHVSPLCADRVNIGTYYVYHLTDNLIYRSVNGGANWSSRGGGPNPGVQIGWLKSHPANAGDLFYQNWNRTFLKRSTDAGATWIDLGFTTCDRMAFGKELLGSTYKTIFVIGTRSGKYGLWVSKDNCASWIDYTAFGIPTVSAITCLQGDPSLAGRVLMGTYGNGYYVGSGFV